MINPNPQIELRDYGEDARRWFTEEELMRKDSMHQEGNLFVTEETLLSVNDRMIENLNLVVPNSMGPYSKTKRSTDQTLYLHSLFLIDDWTVDVDKKEAIEDTRSGIGDSSLLKKQAQQIDEQKAQIKDLQNLVEKLLRQDKSNEIGLEVHDGISYLSNSDEIYDIDTGGSAQLASTVGEATGSAGSTSL